MREAGLINHWTEEFKADTHQCTQKKRNNKILPEDHKPLTIRSLSGAFAVLTMGILLAFMVFLGECYIKRNLIKIGPNSKRRNQIVPKNRPYGAFLVKTLNL